MKQKFKYSKEDYKKVYELHLINYSLDNDSEYISDEDIKNFVDNEIDNEDKKWYGLNN